MTDQRSPEAKAARRMYKTRRWRLGLRPQVMREEPLCRTCKAKGRTTASQCVDHVVPHRGDPALFFDRDNLQGLCNPCHDRVKQREEVRGYSAALGPDGWPLDPAHPSNQ